MGSCCTQHRGLSVVLWWHRGVGWGWREAHQGGDICILVVDSHCCPAETNIAKQLYCDKNIKNKDVAGGGILEAVYIKDRRLLTTLQTRHCLHTLFPWIILKPSKRYERMTETEGGMFQFKHDLQSIHSSLLCVEFFQGRQYFLKGNGTFCSNETSSISSKYRPTKTVI